MVMLSRRSLMGLGLALPALPRLAWSAAPAEGPRPGPTLLDYNESPWGPSVAARRAMRDSIALAGRYPYGPQYRLIDTYAAQHGLDASQVQLFGGSRLALQHAVMAFTGPRSLVMADPSYEEPAQAAERHGATVHTVALDERHAHDVDAMLAADTQAGLIYVCNPNNPTGTLTPRTAIERLLRDKPEGCVVVVDEAYIHFSEAASCLDLIADHPELLVLQTFSKLYGLAGARLGLAIGQAPLLERLEVHDGYNVANVSALLAGQASLDDPTLIPSRKAHNTRLREATIAWLGERGWRCTASHANCFMIDLRQPAQPVVERLAAAGVRVGRVWPSWPNWMRVSVGDDTDMQRFREAFARAVPS